MCFRSYSIYLSGSLGNQSSMLEQGKERKYLLFCSSTKKIMESKQGRKRTDKLAHSLTHWLTTPTSSFSSLSFLHIYEREKGSSVFSFSHSCYSWYVRTSILLDLNIFAYLRYADHRKIQTIRCNYHFWSGFCFLLVSFYTGTVCTSIAWFLCYGESGHHVQSYRSQFVDFHFLL